MQRYFDVVQNRQGTAVVGATVTVYDSNGNLATLYSNNSNAATSNPVYTNADGEYAFYAANGTYTIQIAATGYAGETKPGVVLFDPLDAGIVSVKDFGARGDGVTDDTAAIQAAVNTGKNVIIPEATNYYYTTATINLLSNQIISGEGAKSQIRISNSVATNNVIAATNRSNVVVRDLAVYATGGSGSISQAGGIAFIGCSHSAVENCLVENHRGNGVNLFNSNNCKVVGNTFLNSPVQNGDTNNLAGADIYVGYSSSNNIVTNNLCASGNATGIGLQSVVGVDKVNDNIVDSNIVQNCKGYGILAYRNDDTSTPSQEVKRNVISNNTVRNITGTILSLVTGQYNFGSGIYLQGAEHCTVVGNTVENTHSGSVVITELLAPGAIGMTNSSSAVIANNTINEPKFVGIYIGDPNNFGIINGSTIVEGNEIRNVPNRSGIKIINRGNVAIRNNTVSNVDGGPGIWVANTLTTRKNITIIGNHVFDITNTGIVVDFAENVIVANNLINTVGIHGVGCSNSNTISINNNTIVDHVTRGIELTATNTNATITNNTIKGTGTSVEGLRVSSQAYLFGNRVSGCVSALVGDFANFRRILPPDVATPSVTDGRYFTTANTVATTITTFSGAIDGQEIHVYFNDANTTLKFSGTTNLRGNSNVDRLMAVGDSIRAVLRSVPGSSSWAVTIIEG